VKSSQKQRKNVKDLKSARIGIRATMRQWKELDAAASKVGLSLSSWLLATGLREARGGQALVPVAATRAVLVPKEPE
jgi:uncharacterized protein (DUF1778 family)